MERIGQAEKHLLILALLLLLCKTSSAAVDSTRMNPHTRKLDYCASISTEDGSVKNRQCKDLKVPNGSLTDNGDGSYSLTTGSIGGGNSIFFEDSGDSIGNNQNADVYFDAIDLVYINGSGQNINIGVNWENLVIQSEGVNWTDIPGYAQGKTLYADTNNAIGVNWDTAPATSTGSSDNLGNHTATQNLDMSNFDIENVSGLYATNGTFTNISGTLTGKADTATALETARTIAGVSFDGTANIAIASTGLSDTADLLYETELDIFSELQTQIADKTLINEEDAVAFDTSVSTPVLVVSTSGSFGDDSRLYFGASDDASIYFDGSDLRMDLPTGDALISNTGTFKSSNGVITLGGVGNTNNENIDIDFERLVNRAEIGSTSGVNQIKIVDGIQFSLGDDQIFGLGSTPDIRMLWETTGNDNFQLGIEVGSADGSGYLSLMDTADMGNANRSPSSTSANPVLRVYSSDATQADDYIEMYHDQTDGVITTGSGSLILSTLTGTYGSGSAYVCVNNNGGIFASDAVCP